MRDLLHFQSPLAHCQDTCHAIASKAFSNGYFLSVLHHSSHHSQRRQDLDSKVYFGSHFLFYLTLAMLMLHPPLIRGQRLHRCCHWRPHCSGSILLFSLRGPRDTFQFRWHLISLHISPATPLYSAPWKRASAFSMKRKHQLVASASILVDVVPTYGSKKDTSGGTKRLTKQLFEQILFAVPQTSFQVSQSVNLL